jgi:flagellar protein FliO/FliZ
MKNNKVKVIIVLTIIFLLNNYFIYPQDKQNDLTNDPQITTVSANNDSVTYDLKDHYSINFISVAARAIFTLVIIIAAILVVVYCMKRFFYSPKKHQVFNDFVVILGKVHLTQKNAIYLIKAADKVLVVGVTEQNISLLSTLDNPELIAQFNQAKTEMSFKNQLIKILSKHNEK